MTYAKICAFSFAICIILQVTNVRSTFQCTNGNRILDNWFCNGENNCGDFSDEFYGCDKRLCGKGKFRCKDLQCLPISVRCNTIPDCSDGSDEIYCDHELGLKNCTIQEGKFLCADASRCISLTQVCDEFEDCMDGSDENNNCLKYDAEICNSCPHACYRTPFGPQCFCNPSNEFHTLCKEINECNSYHITCEQKCVRYGDVEQCSCNERYFINGGTACISDYPKQNVMVYYTNDEIKQLNISDNNLTTLKSEFSADALVATQHSIIWSMMSNNEGCIQEIDINSQETKKISDTGSEQISSIAVDWITGNVYFTSQYSLSVCTRNGKICNKLKTSVFEIKYVALVPKFGQMFWIVNPTNKYIKPRIMKSSMDGSQEEIFIERMLRAPAALYVDEPFETLYWFDAELGKIERISFNGMIRQTMLFDAKYISSFAAFEGKLYYAWERDSYSLCINSRVSKELFREDEKIKYLHVYKPSPYSSCEISNPCNSNRSKCIGLGLLRPATSPNALECTCICEDFKNTTADKNWCGDQLSHETFMIKHHSQDEDLKKGDSNVSDVSEFAHWNKVLTIFLPLVIVVNILLTALLYLACEKWKASKRLREENIILRRVINSYSSSHIQ